MGACRCAVDLIQLDWRSENWSHLCKCSLHCHNNITPLLLAEIRRPPNRYQKFTSHEIFLVRNTFKPSGDFRPSVAGTVVPFMCADIFLPTLYLKFCLTFLHINFASQTFIHKKHSISIETLISSKKKIPPGPQLSPLSLLSLLNFSERYSYSQWSGPLRILSRKRANHLCPFI